MGQTSVAQFASELGLPAELLLEQLKGAGVNKTASGDQLTEQDKTSLLEYLRKEHGAAQEPKNKITLTRKQVTEIKKSDSTGRARTIQVEVRKKRVLVRRDPSSPDFPEEAAIAETAMEIAPKAVIEDLPLPEPVPDVIAEPVVEEAIVEPEQEIVVAEPVVEAAPSKTIKKSLISAEQMAQREQEAKRHAALVAIQTEDIRKKQELLQRRQEEEAKKAAEAAAAAAKAAELANKPTKLSEGTLHKPAAKEGTKPEDKSAKKGAAKNKE